MTAPRARVPRILITAAALYWLLVVYGLAGVTFLRLAHDPASSIMALWAGTVLGIALGQLAAWLRIRWWAPALFLPMIMISGVPLLVPMMSFPFAERFALAFLPATLGGYLALSERGALVAVWFPTVLWMLVILEGGNGRAAFDLRTSLPLVVALGALFIAFLRARETRRAAIWQSHSTDRLATGSSRVVLRASPLRSTFAFGWTVLVGGLVVAVTAWVAPRLWEKEHAIHPATAFAVQRAQMPPCCDRKRVRVREYLPLLGQQDEPSQTCRPCRATVATAKTPSTNGGRGLSGWSYATDEGLPTSTSNAASTPGTTTGISDGTVPSGAGAEGVPTTADNGGHAGGAITEPPAPVELAQAQPPSRPSAVSTQAAALAIAAPPPPAVAPAPAPAPLPAESASPPSAQGGDLPRPVVLTIATDVGTPVTWVLGSTIGFVLLLAAFRALRRFITLAHLARPFWTETVDQQVSNHWQRVLVGLRDAGLFPGPGELPGAFATRIGIPEMAVCAAILDRVRHGVRVERADLEAMSHAARATFRRARQWAGVAGRLASWIRSPLV